jgi:hypothetical protein
MTDVNPFYFWSQNSRERKVLFPYEGRQRGGDEMLHFYLILFVTDKFPERWEF